MIQELRQLESEGFVRCVSHNELPLLVWNYTPVVQFDKSWGDYPLLRQCRGLITDTNGNIVARSYEKFFNYEEHNLSEIPIGAKNFTVQTKLDGSLLIVSRYQDKVFYSTRGSFYSDQSLLGERLFKELYSEDWIESGKTYLFELIGPSNRIVVCYPYDDLILHGVIDTTTGLDSTTDKPFKTVECHEVNGELFGPKLYNLLHNLNSSNEEGFVIKVKEPNIPTWMCKIKFENYCHLHKIVTGINSVHIWETLKDGKTLDEVVEVVPDELYDWIKQTKYDLENSYSLLYSEAIAAFLKVENMSTRKEQAIYLNKNHSEVSVIVFSILDGKSYSDSIWKMIKPKRFCPFEDKLEG